MVARVLELFNMTVNPIGLSALEDCLDIVDKHKKGTPVIILTILLRKNVHNNNGKEHKLYHLCEY